MRLHKLTPIALLAATAVGSLAAAPSASAATIRAFGLTDSNTLVSFDLDDPMSTQQIDVSGVDGTLLGIDFRPANGLLYTISDSNDIYTIDPATGVATLQSTLDPLEFMGGQMSGFDFNPAADRLRLEGTNDQNFRINVDTGAIADTDPDAPGVQPDGTIAYAADDANAGVDPNVTAVGYTNSFPGAPAGRSTVLYGIDFELDTLVLQNPPNDGTLNTIGSLGVDFDEVGGFDIFSPMADDNTAFATSNGTLYAVDLGTGAATAQGSIGDGDTRLVGLATTAVPEPGTVSALVGLGLAAIAARRRGA